MIGYVVFDHTIALPRRYPGPVASPLRYRKHKNRGTGINYSYIEVRPGTQLPEPCILSLTIPISIRYEHTD